MSERERLPVMSLIFVLLPRGYRAQGGGFRLEVGGNPTQQIWFKEVCLWRQQPQPWWEESPGLMALYPLCQHGKPRRDAVSYAARKITERATDTIVRADLLTTLGIFGKLVSPDLDMVQLIGREHMRESKFFQEIQAEAAIEQARAYIVEAIEVRFGPKAAAEFKGVLQGIADPEQLAQLHRLAIRGRLAELRRAAASSAE